MTWLTLLLAGCSPYEVEIVVPTWCAEERNTRVVAIIDGDTIDVEPVLGSTPERVRLLGVQAPELYKGDGDEDCDSQDDELCCYGVEAADWLAEQIPPGSEVRLSFDIDCTDIYDRTLAYVWDEEERDPDLPPPESDDEAFLNEQLLLLGYARIYEAEVENAQDIRYIERFQQDQVLAQQSSRGLWAECLDDSR